MKQISVPVMISGHQETRTETVYNVRDFPYADFLDSPTVRKRGTWFLNIPAAFDIETTSIDRPAEQGGPFAFMYHWQFCIDDKVCFGRTWEDYEYFQGMLSEVLQLSDSRKLVVYVHNLAFEFQFAWRFWGVESIFARSPREPMKVECKCIQWRCSYILSNMNLLKFCENSAGCIHYKLRDTYDYRKLRTADTPLTEEEEAYCYNDVRGLCECIADRLRHDSITSIPLTSTGYVRRDARAAMKENPWNRRKFRHTRLDEKLYTMMRTAFRGGNTHCNGDMTGQILDDVASYDLASSYPASIMLDRFPMGAFSPIRPDRLHYHLSKDHAVIGRFLFLGIRQKQRYGIPYIDLAHCVRFSRPVMDNGRVLAADMVEMILTDVDFKIIERTYNFQQVLAKDTYATGKGKLPRELRNLVLEYFRMKCELKHEKKTDPEKEYEYAKIKNKINSFFGMMVTDITSDEILFTAGQWTTEGIPEDMTPEEWRQAKLDKYYDSWNNFLSYQHGVYITANARARLQLMIERVGIRDVLYCDTDSIKCRGDHKKDFDDENRKILKMINNCDIPPKVEVAGKTYTMGTWEYEGTYKSFRSWGSKKYIIEDQNGRIETTVAGLGKKEGAKYFSEHGGVSAFRPGTVIHDSGRLTAWYSDEPIHKITVDGCTMTSAGNVALLPGEYTLGITGEYSAIIGLPPDEYDAIINRGDSSQKEQKTKQRKGR